MKFFAIALMGLFVTNTQAQVTIGSAIPPAKAALLDLKTQVPTVDNVSSDKGGIVLPRVKLVSLATLEPFISTADPEWTANATAVKMAHAGLMVYNLTTTAPFSKGLYIFDGSSWAVFKDSRNMNFTADNGLTATSNGNGQHNIRWGGELIEDETQIDIDASTQDLIFNVENNQTDNHEHGFRIKGLHALGSSQALVVDTDGKLGKMPNIPSKLAFMQSETVTGFTQAQVNSDSNNSPNTGVVLPWADTDIETNNSLVELDFPDNTNPLAHGIYDENSFILLEDANIEMSGYLGFIGNTPNRTVIVNVILEVKKWNGTDYNDWSVYSAIRGVYTGNVVTYYRQTLSIPPVMAVLSAGSKIRMRIMRPYYQSSLLGEDFGGGQIIAPVGAKYSKALKIIAQ